MLPPGTTDDALSPADAAKPVGTVIGQRSISLMYMCLKLDETVTASYVASLDVFAATRPPKPADWPAGEYYDALQWSWKVNP